MPSVCLLIIDPQNDFCDKKGTLFVPGATEDMERLTAFIKTSSKYIQNIVVTLDYHKDYHIASPIFWKNAEGIHPKYFMSITAEDMYQGKWMVSNPSHSSMAYSYLQALEKNSRYILTVWPPHCIIGTNGADIFPPVGHAVSDFDSNTYGGVDYIIKSTNSFTEHYSAVKAEIPVSTDKRTLPNKEFIMKVSGADKVIVAGEALSHCVANTVMDLSVSLGGDLSKFILLEDATSPVNGFERFGDLFLEKAIENGMKISDTATVGTLL